MSEQIYLYLNEQQAGPYTIEQIKELINQKTVTSQTYAFDNASQNWVIISDIPLLKDLFPAGSAQEFYFYINNAQIGPYSSIEIKEKLKAGEISLQDYFFDKGTGGWIVFSESNVYKEITVNDNSLTQTAEVKKSDILADNKEIPSAKELESKQVSSDSSQTTSTAKTESSHLQAVAKSTAEPNAEKQKAIPSDEKTENTEKKTAAIQFPCKNHPTKESYLMCPECNMDFCEDCLVKINDKHYCKECYTNNKEKIDSAAKPAKNGFFAKLFGKKK